MALRTVRQWGDDLLRKKSKPVTDMTPRLRRMVEDMFETMYDYGGVGLAAPQVGVLKRIVVIDVDREKSYVLVNPEILEASGEQADTEGCLSVLGKHAMVRRPQKVRFRAMDIDMNPFEMEAEGLLARAVCHECDHLDGILYVDKMEGPLLDNEPAEDMGEDTGD